MTAATFDHLFKYKHTFTENDFDVVQSVGREFIKSLADVTAMSLELIYVCEKYIEFTRGYQGDSSVISVAQTTFRHQAEWLERLFKKLHDYCASDPMIPFYAKVIQELMLTVSLFPPHMESAEISRLAPIVLLMYVRLETTWIDGRPDFTVFRDTQQLFPLPAPVLHGEPTGAVANHGRPNVIFVEDTTGFSNGPNYIVSSTRRYIGEGLRGLHRHISNNDREMIPPKLKREVMHAMAALKMYSPALTDRVAYIKVHKAIPSGQGIRGVALKLHPEVKLYHGCFRCQYLWMCRIPEDVAKEDKLSDEELDKMIQKFDARDLDRKSVFCAETYAQAWKPQYKEDLKAVQEVAREERKIQIRKEKGLVFRARDKKWVMPERLIESP